MNNDICKTHTKQGDATNTSENEPCKNIPGKLETNVPIHLFVFACLFWVWEGGISTLFIGWWKDNNQTMPKEWLQFTNSYLFK